MNALDFFFLVIIGLGVIFGVVRGFVKELIGIVAVFTAIYVAKWLSPTVAKMMEPQFTHITAVIFAYIIILVAFMVATFFLYKTIDKILDRLSMGGINKLLGGLFGGLKFAIILSLIFNLLEPANNKFHLIKTETIDNSAIYQPIIKLAPNLWEEAKAINQKTTNDE